MCSLLCSYPACPDGQFYWRSCTAHSKSLITSALFICAVLPLVMKEQGGTCPEYMSVRTHHACTLYPSLSARVRTSPHQYCKANFGTPPPSTSQSKLWKGYSWCLHVKIGHSMSCTSLSTSVRKSTVTSRSPLDMLVKDISLFWEKGVAMVHAGHSSGSPKRGLLQQQNSCAGNSFRFPHFSFV